MYVKISGVTVDYGLCWTVMGFVPSSSDEKEARIPVATVGYKDRLQGPCSGEI